MPVPTRSASLVVLLSFCALSAAANVVERAAFDRGI